MQTARSEKRSKDGGRPSLFSLKAHRQSSLNQRQIQHFANGDQYEGLLEDNLVRPLRLNLQVSLLQTSQHQMQGTPAYL